MSDKVGHLSFYDSQDGYGFSKPYSEKTAELIDNEAKELIDAAHKKAHEVLEANIEGLTKLANLLLEREVIFTEDMENIFGPRKPKDGDVKVEEAVVEETVVVEAPAQEAASEEA
jgi:cell division protease FtsH